MTDLTNLFGLEVSPKQTSKNFTNWDYIAEFIVDLRHEPDYEIINRHFITLSGDMSAECWFSECTGNVEISTILETLPPGEVKPGVYRFVYGAKSTGEQYETQDGTEYDSWEEYELLGMYLFDDEEAKICLQYPDSNNPIGDRVMTSKKHALDVVDDLVAGYLYYDRKEDEDMSRDEIEELFEFGGLTVKEVVDRFERTLREHV